MYLISCMCKCIIGYVLKYLSTRAIFRSCFGGKKEYDSMTRFGTYLPVQTYTYAILNPFSEEQVKQIQCLKNKKSCQCQQIILVLIPIIQVTSVSVVYSYQASLNLFTPVNVCGSPRTDQKLIGLALLHFYLLYFIYTSYILDLFEPLFPAALIYIWMLILSL